MSRHEVLAKDRHHKVIVGWDHPLQTFFMQVIDREAEAAGKDVDKFVAWRGTLPREIYEVEALRQILARYADLTAELGATLYGDKVEGR